VRLRLLLLPPCARTLLGLRLILVRARGVFPRVTLYVHLGQGQELRILQGLQGRQPLADAQARLALLLCGQVRLLQALVQKMQTALLPCGFLLGHRVQRLHMAMAVAVRPSLQARQLRRQLLDLRQQLLKPLQRLRHGHSA
jgi:hypothetical protein